MTWMVGSAPFALPLNFSYSILIVVPYIISLVANTIISFAVSYTVFYAPIGSIYKALAIFQYLCDMILFCIFDLNKFTNYGYWDSLKRVYSFNIA
jgi:hypothetical protein